MNTDLTIELLAKIEEVDQNIHNLFYLVGQIKSNSFRYPENVATQNRQIRRIEEFIVFLEMQKTRLYHTVETINKKPHFEFVQTIEVA
ncbi:hypothetical protein QNI16_07375 [Cytophagaceae bacterium YF14B1]|uniref:Uncharacterized protein n=1 Tax=Xanthocytophaga flava TaxID=3048013 RepID=A0AAE3QK09_9BACT|nr:hypothetical protein [Xanthocytophaga flavus]MDJ1480300.1 hypothetical protein [Xanthocytophaga flavus]